MSSNIWLLNCWAEVELYDQVHNVTLESTEDDQYKVVCSCGISGPIMETPKIAAQVWNERGF